MDNSPLQQVRQVIEALPRLSIGTFPTPLRRMNLPAGAVWIKDDAACSPVYGGNKVRKLEFLLGQLQASGMRRITVWGDVESHTVAAVTRLASAAGFGVDVVVFPSPSPALKSSEVCAGLRAAGATVHRVGSMLAAWMRSRWLTRGGRSALVPLGVSTPRSDVGYVLAAMELAKQLGVEGAGAVERIYLPLGSGGTVAGLLVGLALAVPTTTVIAVRTVDRVVTPQRGVARRVRAIVRELNLPHDLGDAAMRRLERIDNRYLGRGYRDTTDAARRAVTIADAHGLLLEPVFTSKAFASLLDDLAGQPSRPRLFWNTHDPRFDPPSARQAQHLAGPFEHRVGNTHRTH